MKSMYGSALTGTTINLTGNLITGIEVHRDFRGKGYAEDWLTVVCADADFEQEHLYLTIEPQEPDISRERLRYWYERHGFECLPEDPDMRVMMRIPKRHMRLEGEISKVVDGPGGQRVVFRYKNTQYEDDHISFFFRTPTTFVVGDLASVTLKKEE